MCIDSIRNGRLCRPFPDIDEERTKRDRIWYLTRVSQPVALATTRRSSFKALVGLQWQTPEVSLWSLLHSEIGSREHTAYGFIFFMVLSHSCSQSDNKLAERPVVTMEVDYTIWGDCSRRPRLGKEVDFLILVPGTTFRNINKWNCLEHLIN